MSHIVSTDLIKVLRPDLGSAPTSEIQAPVAAAVEKLAEDQDVDLLAMARNPKGVDVKALEGKLRARADEHERMGSVERRKSGEYWRHIGALAFLHDAQKALAAYHKATTLDPDNADGWNQVGHLLDRSGEFDEARKAYEKVLMIGERIGDRATVGIATSNLGLIYQTRGDLDRAEEMQLKGLEIDEELGNKEGIAASYGNLGLIYEAGGDLSRAEEMQLKSLRIEEELGNREGIAASYGNLGLIYEAGGDLSRAEEMQLRGLRIEEELNNKEGMAASYGNLGVICLNRGEFSRAEEMLRKSLKLETELDHKEGMAMQHANLGIVFEEKAEIAEACARWRDALELYAIIDLPQEVAEIRDWMRQAGCEGIAPKGKSPSEKSLGSGKKGNRKRGK